jgi:cysteine-rich repeat protein
MHQNELTIDLRRKKYGELLSFLPRVTLRSMAAVLVMSVMVVQTMNLNAFEAHIINVTANIVSDGVNIDPEGGQFCDLEGVDVILTSSVDLGASSSIIYTLDGTDPTCPNDAPNEFTYTGSFHLISSSTVKARTCHDSKESVVFTAFFDISPNYCPQECGNGIKEPPEECDGNDGVPLGSHCTNDCKLKIDECDFDLDVMMILDRSGSMGYDGAPSSCKWWELKMIGPSYQWIQNTTQNATEDFCLGKNLPGHPSVFTPPVLDKMDYAKIDADLFLDNLKSTDQSGLVSYANNATLDKTLSYDHDATKSAVNAMTPNGATNIGDSINLSNSELISERSNPKAHKIAILLTDGMANKPNGPGHGEYPADVAYALNKASDAAAQGIQIFTIGLGSDIDQVMLQQIASTTNGTYHFAPAADQLKGIFENIISEFCAFGKISGCKYDDHNNDGQISGEDAIPGWEISLSNGLATSTQSTDQNGCYEFSGLPSGFYTLSEGLNATQGAFIETYPGGKYYSISLAKGEHKKNRDFGNYFPRCGNGRIDKDYGENCDDGNTNNGDGCSATCQNSSCTPAFESCDGVDNDCDGITDNNVFEDKVASSSPNQANLEDGTNVTGQVAFSDDTYGVQPVNIPRFVYLQWYFSDISDGASTTMANLAFEHHENNVSVKVQWKQPDSTWKDVCTPQKSAFDIISNCNLLPYLNTTNKAKDVNLRLRLISLGSSEEYLDWAKLTISYRNQVQCPVCGDGQKEGNEICDDGNNVFGDGCSAACQTEDPSQCVKINEVYYNTDSCHGTSSDEWIELYNICDNKIDLKDWYFVDNGGLLDKETINQNFEIDAHGFALLASSDSTWNNWPLIPTSTPKFAFGGSRMFKGLGNNQDRVFIYDANGLEIDQIGWGSDKSAFDPSVSGVLKGHSISRHPAGFDTGTSTDWMDTHASSTPPGPDPGTSPHDVFGKLLALRSIGELRPEPGSDIPGVCCDYGQEAFDNNDELLANPDLTMIETVNTDFDSDVSASMGAEINNISATAPPSDISDDRDKPKEIIIIDMTAMAPETQAIIDNLPAETPIAGGQ